MQPLVVIVGETGSGKSGLAMELAQKFNGEIIAADAMTVYKDFDIGTAKPSSEDLAKVKHHLLDVADANDSFSAAMFQKLANDIINDIHKRKKLPIMVGGSGLYIDSVLYGYDFLPPSSLKLRAELDSMTLDELHDLARSGGFDLESIDKQNKRRVVRLIENSGTVATQKPLRENTLILGITIQRYALLQSVEKRIDAMLLSGLQDEVERLSSRYSWEVEPMKSIGYREWRAYFGGSISLDQTKQQIILDTMRLAKKQRTWFKRNKSIHWLSEQAEAVGYTTTFLNN